MVLMETGDAGGRMPRSRALKLSEGGMAGLRTQLVDVVSARLGPPDGQPAACCRPDGQPAACCRPQDMDRAPSAAIMLLLHHWFGPRAVDRGWIQHVLAKKPDSDGTRLGSARLADGTCLKRVVPKHARQEALPLRSCRAEARAAFPHALPFLTRCLSSRAAILTRCLSSRAAFPLLLD